MTEQKKLVNLLDKMSPEALAKIDARTGYNSVKIHSLMPREWAMLGELMHYGSYSAVQAFFDDVITIGQAQALLDGAKKVHSRHVYDSAVVQLAVIPNKDRNHFTKMMKPYIDDMGGVE